MFEPVTTLRQRGPVDQIDDIDAPEGLEVDWDEGERLADETHRADPSVGCDRVIRYPARVAGRPAFLIRRRWAPGWGYSAQGDEDTVEMA